MTSTPTNHPEQSVKVQQQKVHWHNTFAPILLILLTLMVSVGFQGMQLAKDHELLKNSKANQDSALDESRKLRAQLDSIATQTAQLATSGNVNAKLIIEGLRAKGITVKSDSASAD